MKSLKNLASIEEFEIRNLNEGIYFNWLKEKENCIAIVGKTSNFSRLYWLCEQLYINKNIKASKFYLIFNNTNISKIISLSFAGSKVDDLLNTLSTLYEYFENNHHNLCTIYDQILLYFPAEIGNVFSKKRYLYEINTYYMHSLQSVKNIDGDRRSNLDNWRIEKEQAIFNEYLNNSASNFNEDIAYLDFLDFYIESGILIAEHFNFAKNTLSKEEFHKILDALNRSYFEFVVLQQINLVNAMNAKLDIPENTIKGENKRSKSEIFHKLTKLLNKNKNIIDKHTYRQIFSCLRKWRYKSSQLKIHPRNRDIDQIISQPQTDSKCKQFVLTNILSYFLHDNCISYTNKALDELVSIFPANKTHQLKDILEAISSDIFGKESPLYDDKDKRKVFFREVVSSFNLYADKGFTSTDIKYFLDDKFEDIAEKVITEIGEHTKQKSRYHIGITFDL